MMVATRGLQDGASRLPDPLRRAAIRLFLRTAIGRTMGDLAGTAAAESRLVQLADGPAHQWAGVSARTRFSIGARSPAYYAPAAYRLADVMPAADVEILPRLGHNAAPRAPRALVDSLAGFLGV